MFLFVFLIHANSPAADYPSGLAAYENKNYEESTKIFEELLAHNPEDYNATFNLALSLYQQGRVGAALGLMRQLNKRTPQPATSQAIAFAEAALGSSSSPFRLSESQKRGLLLLVWLTAGALLIYGARMAIAPFKAKKPFTMAFWIAMTTSLILAGSATALTFSSAKSYGTVISGDTPLYSSPNTSSATLDTLGEGEHVQIAKNTGGDWLQVVSSGGLPGWVQKPALILE